MAYDKNYDKRFGLKNQGNEIKFSSILIGTTIFLVLFLALVYIIFIERAKSNTYCEQYNLLANYTNGIINASKANVSPIQNLTCPNVFDISGIVTDMSLIVRDRNGHNT